MDNQLDSYISTERAKGLSTDAIRSELLSKGWDSIAVHRALNKDTVASVENPLHLTGATAILLAGVGLILVAAISFLGYSYPELSPLSRFLLIAVPNFLLFLCGSYLAKGDDLKIVKEATHATGQIMLPITLGVFLYQFGFYNKADALLMAYSVALAFPVYLYSAIKKQHAYGNLLVTLGASAIAVFLLTDTVLDGYRSSLMLFVVSTATLWAGWGLKKQTDHRYLSGLVSVGTLLLIISYSSLVRDLMLTWANSAAFATAIIAVLTGGGLMGAAWLFGRLFTPWTRLELFHQRLLIVAAILFTFLMLIGNPSDLALLDLIAVCFAAIFVVLGLECRIKVMTYLGLIGGAISLVNLLFGSIERVALIIAMFTVGFGAIMLSVYLIRRTKRAVTDGEPHWRTSLIDDSTALTLGVGTGEPPSVFIILVRIFLIFLALSMLQYMIFSTGFSSTSGGSDFRHNSSFI